MTRSNLAIAMLSATAAFMLAAHVFLPTPAGASNVIKDRDYQVLTARVQQGGEGLYILDNRTGQIAVFTYDPATRNMRPRVVRPVADAFTAGR